MYISFIKNVFRLLKLSLIVIVIALFFKLFFFTGYYVNSGSMIPELLPGDFIIVDKLVYGPRVIKLLQLRKDNVLDFIRISGYGKVKKNDIVVFNFPSYSQMTSQPSGMYGNFIIKRCYGVPGDIVHIHRDYTCFLSSEELNRMNNKIFPYNKRNEWKVNNYGPFYIPGKEKKKRITSNELNLYHSILRYEKYMSQSDSIFFDNQANCYEYEFKYDYYFMLGDNFYESQDSRFWGLVPENNIIGKASIILFSYGEDGFRWNRILKKIK